MLLSERIQPKYILYDSNYPAFWKRQSYSSQCLPEVQGEKNEWGGGHVNYMYYSGGFMSLYIYHREPTRLNPDISYGTKG